MKKVPIPYVTTLAEVYEDFNDDLSSFITFRVQNGSESIISNATIPFCRFRHFNDSDVLEIRSCDCDGTICGHPTQKIYISKNQLHNYYFSEQINMHYIFICNVLILENTNDKQIPGLP
ncbi:hypothetical protein BSK59_16290 [Paenibacillus odorifer]|nr:hypothetical protein BSK59_16290 [Paenibacillus odorifer]